MARYRCPSCLGLPLRMRPRQGRLPVCARCGLSLQKAPRSWSGPILAVGVAVLGLGIAALPNLIEGAASLAVGPAGVTRLLERFDPAPDPREQPAALLSGPLFDDLAQADQEWVPRAEPLPDGATRYLYKHRLGEAELSLDQIRDRIANPPTYEQERLAITELLRTLQSSGVRLVLSEPRKSGAAGEWDHAARTLRIQPQVVAKGTVEFAKVLNHEAIHVAQSCAAGSLRAPPRLLGLDTRLDKELETQLRDPLYAATSPEEQAMEREAYANQQHLELGASLVRTHCPSRG